MNSKILIYTRNWFEGYYSKLQSKIEQNSDFEVVRFSDYSVKGSIDFRKKAVKLRDDLHNKKISIIGTTCHNIIVKNNSKISQDGSGLFFASLMHKGEQR